MDPIDRLAAYVAGELHADERAELEVALRRDPELRRMLDAMRRADEAVAELPSPRPPDGFDDRLDRRLDEVLAETLPAEGDGPGSAKRAGFATPAWSSHEDDELAARRRRRSTPPWIGVAAAGLLVVAGGVAVTQLGGDGGGDQDAMETEEAIDEPADTDAGQDDARSAGDGPVVVAADRDVDVDDLDALLAEELTTNSAQGLDAAAGVERARSYARQLGLDAVAPPQELTADDRSADGEPSGDATDGADDSAGDEGSAEESESAEDTEEATAADEDAPADEEEPTQSEETDAADAPVPEASGRVDPERLPEIQGRDGEPLGADASADVARCLDELLGEEPDAIPVYTELATFEERPAIVFGLLTPHPDTGRFTRREVWALDRDTCQVLRFSQDGA